MKNCGSRFHLKIAQKEFLQDLYKVIAAKVCSHLNVISIKYTMCNLLQNNPPNIVRERVLGLIQYWADAFKGKPEPTAVEVFYRQLKMEGVEFPPTDLDNMVLTEMPDRVRSSLNFYLCPCSKYCLLCYSSLHPGLLLNR